MERNPEESIKDLQYKENVFWDFLDFSQIAMRGGWIVLHTLQSVGFPKRHQRHKRHILDGSGGARQPAHGMRISCARGGEASGILSSVSQSVTLGPGPRKV